MCPHRRQHFFLCEPSKVQCEMVDVFCIQFGRIAENPASTPTHTLTIQHNTHFECEQKGKTTHSTVAMSQWFSVDSWTLNIAHGTDDTLIMGV